MVIVWCGGDVEFNIGNDANCGNSESKADCSEDTASDDVNSNVDGGPNNDGVSGTNDDDRDCDDSFGESDSGADRHKNDDSNQGGGCLDSITILL